jgi:NO-binding membrane sensor protein with MHYT domain
VSRPDAPPPAGSDLRWVLRTGTALWAVAFLALLPFHHRLSDSGRGYYLTTCAVGFALGFVGMVVAPWVSSGQRRQRGEDAPEGRVP